MNDQLSIFDAEPEPPPRRPKFPNLELGRQLAKEGAERAAAKAEADHEGWRAAAYAAFVEYAREHRGELFQTEDVRHAYADKLPTTTKDLRCWGAIPGKAEQSGLVEWVDIPIQSKDSKSHGAPSNAWTWCGDGKEAS